MIARKLANSILSSSRDYPLVGIVGPRQSGKTTLVQAVFSDYKYVNLEAPDLRRFAQEDPRGFMATYPSKVIFDEVQRVPELLSYLQVHVDSIKDNGQFILTGSQNFLLMESISQSLAGRIALHTLLPFSLEELDKVNPKEFVLKGGYPKIYDTDISFTQWYGNYVQTYLDRDIRTLSRVEDLATFEKFVRLCAGRTGQLLNLSSLAIDAGITHNTAKAWISLLKTSFIVYTLEPFHKNYNKRLIKAPKMYFVDTGLACQLLNIQTQDQLQSHPLYGALFETMVVGEYFKYTYNRALPQSIYFWRDKTGREVDMILEKSNTIFPIEIKSGSTVNDEYFQNINYFLDLSGQEGGGVIFAGSNEQKRGNVYVHPVRGMEILFS